MRNEIDRSGTDAANVRDPGAIRPVADQQRLLRDLPEKFRELHWTLWVAEAELEGSRPEASLDYLELLAQEIEEAIARFH
jgi:hypothetical protein